VSDDELKRHFEAKFGAAPIDVQPHPIRLVNWFMSK
jgi:hypothetical protein